MKPLLLLTLLSASAYSQTPTLDKLTTKPNPTPEYQTSKEWFQKEGDSEDSELSMLKNRIDMPTSSAKYKKVPFDELLKLTQQLGGAAQYTGQGSLQDSQIRRLLNPNTGLSPLCNGHPLLT